MAGAAPWHRLEVLSPLQQRIARIVTSLPEADGFALAGGAALVLANVVERETRDLDFFGATADDVDRLLPAVRSALTADGLDVRVDRAHHGFVRLTVVGGEESMELDLAADARIRPAEPGPLGPTLSLEELAADKLLALFDRAQARDFVDVAALTNRLGFDRLCALAREKDAGFSPTVLRDMLGSFGRFTLADFELSQAAYDQLAQTVESWRDHLSRAS
jgi:hypothetical protein